jgi:hypothetical protein
VGCPALSLRRPGAPGVPPATSTSDAAALTGYGHTQRTEKQRLYGHEDDHLSRTEHVITSVGDRCLRYRLL